MYCFIPLVLGFIAGTACNQGRGRGCCRRNDCLIVNCGPRHHH